MQKWPGAYECIQVHEPHAYKVMYWPGMHGLDSYIYIYIYSMCVALYIPSQCGMIAIAQSIDQ